MTNLLNSITDTSGLKKMADQLEEIANRIPDLLCATCKQKLSTITRYYSDAEMEFSFDELQGHACDCPEDENNRSTRPALKLQHPK